MPKLCVRDLLTTPKRSSTSKCVSVFWTLISLANDFTIVRLPVQLEASNSMSSSEYSFTLSLFPVA